VGGSPNIAEHVIQDFVVPTNLIALKNPGDVKEVLQAAW
jgi:hypothetical protein